MFCYGPLVSELGGPECMVPPTPSLGGLCPPRVPLLRRLCVLYGTSCSGVAEGDAHVTCALRARRVYISALIGLTTAYIFCGF